MVDMVDAAADTVAVDPEAANHFVRDPCMLFVEAVGFF